LNTKKLSLTIVFAALAIGLNPAFTYIALNFPLAPGLIYQIWEIPIIVAFLIISPVAGIAISLLNTAVLFVVFPGALPTGPAYNLAATLSMQVGILAILTIAKKVSCRKNPNTNVLFNAKWVTLSTSFGVLTRVAFMSIVLYFALPQPSPIGFYFPLDLTIGFLPFAAIFNASIALYTILIAFLIAQRVQKVLHLTLPKETKCDIIKNEKLET
jgi:riboflavin transporter FmnP